MRVCDVASGFHRQLSGFAPDGEFDGRVPLLIVADRCSITTGCASVTGETMWNVRGTNVTIFVLFFGLSLVEALQTRDWLRVLFWLAIGIVFLRADGLRKESQP